jgi:hypothetical protein
MGRRPNEDRTQVSAVHLGLRLTEAEHLTLQALVDEENAQLYEMDLPTASSGSSVVRRLILAEGKRRGVRVEYEDTNVVVILDEPHVGAPSRTVKPSVVRVSLPALIQELGTGKETGIIGKSERRVKRSYGEKALRAAVKKGGKR